MLKHLAVCLMLAMAPALIACGSNVEGYDTLDETLTPAQQADKSVFDAGAAYQPVQIFFEVAVTNPDVPEGVKASIRQVDLEVVTALKNYRAAVAANPDQTAAKLQTFMQALGRAQTIMVAVSRSQEAAVFELDGPSNVPRHYGAPIALIAPYLRE